MRSKADPHLDTPEGHSSATAKDGEPGKSLEHAPQAVRQAKTIKSPRKRKTGRSTALGQALAAKKQADDAMRPAGLPSKSTHPKLGKQRQRVPLVITAAPKRRGRPPIYSEAMVSEICARLAEGRSLVSVSDDADMPSYDHILVWQRDNTDFKRRIAYARSEAAARMADDTIQIADADFPQRALDDPRLANAEVQRAKLRIDTRRWMLEKTAPETYGTVQQVSGTITHEHTHSLVTALAAIRDATPSAPVIDMTATTASEGTEPGK